MSDGGIYPGRRSSCPSRSAPNWKQKAQELAARIKARSADAILEMARRLVATTDDTLFGDTEFALRDQALGIVADAYAEHLPQKVGTPPPPSTAPTAGGRAPFHGYREKTVETLGGAVTCNRAYYYCGLCGEGSCPWDARVGLTDHRLSPAVERLATLCGAVADSFEKGAELLQETAGIRLSESTVQRTTEATGERIAGHLRRVGRSAASSRGTGSATPAGGRWGTSGSTRPGCGNRGRTANGPTAGWPTSG